MGKRILAALAVVMLMAGFVTACGGDDDDDGVAASDTSEESGEEDISETTEMTDPPEDDAAMSGNQLAFCQDWNEPDGAEITIDDVEHSIELASATQSEMPNDVADAIQVAIDLATHVVDNDDGDGIASTDELEAALDANPGFEAASGVIDDHCAAAENAGG